MSVRKPYTIPCPKCKCGGQVELYESVNVAENPELRDAIMGDQLNRVACGDCGYEFRVDKPLLYNDPAHELMLWWMPEGAKNPGATAAEVRAMEEQITPSSEGADVPELQLVFDRTEFIERIFLVEAGLDPRVVEYVKYLIYSKNDAKITADKKRLLFNAQDSTEEQLCFVVQDIETRKLQNLLHYQREAYRGLTEMFSGEGGAGLKELFPGPHISARALALM